MNSVATDDMPLLNALVDQGLIVLTPPQDYDDSYSIDYARRHNCCIVTNDRYNDNILFCLPFLYVNSLCVDDAWVLRSTMLSFCAAWVLRGCYVLLRCLCVCGG